MGYPITTISSQMAPSEVAKTIIREKVEERLRSIRLALGILTVVLWAALGFLIFQFNFDYPLLETLCFSFSLLLTAWLLMFRRKAWMDRVMQHIEHEIRNELNWFF